MENENGESAPRDAEGVREFLIFNFAWFIG
jgi:hypothetical protein